MWCGYVNLYMHCIKKLLRSLLIDTVRILSAIDAGAAGSRTGHAL